MTHQLFLDIEPTSVNCIPEILESAGCKQCEHYVSGAGLQLVVICVGAPRAALSCVGEVGLVSTSWFNAAHPCWDWCSSNTLSSPAEFEEPSIQLNHTNINSTMSY